MKQKQVAALVSIVTLVSILLASCGPSEESDKATYSSSTSTSSNEKYIPGIAAVDIHGNLTSRGFELKSNINTTLSSWTCTDKQADREYEVIVYGKGPTKITKIEATALNYSNKDTGEIAKDFFGFIASVPYDKAAPSQAKEWAMNNVSNSIRTTIGTVKFEIFANPNSPRARILEITPVQ